MNYFLSQLIWKDGVWQAPRVGDRFLDLRPLTAQAKAQSQQGFVLVAADRDPVQGETLLSATHQGALKPKALDAARELLGIPEALGAKTLRGLIQSLLGEYADPDVGLLCPPLMPDASSVMKFRLGDLSYSHTCPKSGPHWENILKVLRKDYRATRETGTGVHRKLLTVWQNQFGIENHELFIPSDLPKEKPLPHETVLRDNFDVGNHADIDAQASSDGGWSWSKIVGAALAVIRTDTQVYAECQSVGQRVVYRADSDLSSANHYVQAQLRTENNAMTPLLLIRKDGTGTLTWYECQLGAGSDVLWLLKMIAGTGTVLQTNALTINTSTWYTIKFSIDGSTIKTFNSGAQVGTDLTDTSISGGLRCGIGCEGSGGSLQIGGIEDFEAADNLEPNEGFTIVENAAGSDSVFTELVESFGYTPVEPATGSDSAEFELIDANTLVLTEPATASDSATFAMYDVMEVLVEDGAVGEDEIALAGVQRTYGPSMVVLKHYYLEDGRLGYSMRTVIAPSHTHVNKVTMFGTAEREIPVPPGPPRIANMTTELADTDQSFRVLFGNRTPRFRRSDLLIGPEGGKESMFLIPFSGVVDSVTFPPGKVVIQEVDNRFRWLRNFIPVITTIENFPDMPQSSRGRFFPIIFGRVSSQGRGDQGAVELFEVDTVLHRYACNRSTAEDVTVYTKTPDETVFQITPYSYTKVDEDKTIGPLTYTLCYIQFDSALPEGTQVRADIDGINFRGGWGLFAPVSGLLENPIDALVNLLYMIGAIEHFDANYDFGSFKEVRDLCETLNYKISWPITESITYEAAITQLVSSFGIDIFPSQLDQITVALTASVPTDRDIFTDELHIERESELITLAQPTKNRFRYQFAWLPAEGRYAEERVYDNVVDQEALANEFTDGIEEEVLELPAIADEDTALSVVLEHSTWLDQQAHRIRVRIGAPPNLQKIDLARIVGITHYGGLQSGGWINEPFKIYRIALNIENLEYEVDMIKRVQPPLPPQPQLIDIGQWQWNSRVGPWYVA